MAVAGAAGKDRLRTVTSWLVAHNHMIGVGVLTFFGLLFVGRGLGTVL